MKDLSLFLSCVRKVSVALSELAIHNTVLEEKIYKKGGLFEL